MRKPLTTVMRHPSFVFRHIQLFYCMDFFCSLCGSCSFQNPECLVTNALEILVANLRPAELQNPSPPTHQTKTLNFPRHCRGNLGVHGEETGMPWFLTILNCLWWIFRRKSILLQKYSRLINLLINKFTRLINLFWLPAKLQEEKT